MGLKIARSDMCDWCNAIQDWCFSAEDYSKINVKIMIVFGLELYIRGWVEWSSQSAFKRKRLWRNSWKKHRRKQNRNFIKSATLKILALHSFNKLSLEDFQTAQIILQGMTSCIIISIHIATVFRLQKSFLFFLIKSWNTVRWVGIRGAIKIIWWYILKTKHDFTSFALIANDHKLYEFFFSIIFFGFKWHWDVFHIFTVNLHFWQSYYKRFPFWFMYLSLLFFMAMYSFSNKGYSI